MAKHNKNKRKSEEYDEKEGWYDDLKPETRQSIWAVVSFVAAAFLGLAWFGSAGRVGESAVYIFTLLFGKGLLFIPFLFMLTGVSLLLGVRKRILGGTLLGSVLLLLSMLTLFDIVFGGHTGGLVGFGVAYLPLLFLEYWASLIIFSAVVVVSFLLMFNIPLGIPSFLRRAPPSRVEEKPKGAEFYSEEVPVSPPPPSAPSEPAESVRDEEHIEQPEIVSLPRKISSAYKTPPLALLEGDRGKPSSGDVRANANIIQRTFQNFSIDVDMGEISIGPAVTQYTLKPAEGVKLSRITNLASNLGLALAAHPLRIEAPIPGRSLVGIEVPNKSIAFVGLKNLLAELMGEKRKEGMFASSLSFALGRDVTGRAVFADLARMPHLLVAGSTGSGKSVAIHSLLLNLLFQNSPERLRLLLIDPKRVELAYYNEIPHLIAPVVVEAKGAIQALRWAVREMEKRYEQLSRAGARDILSYNKDTAENPMPYLVIVIDELADLMTSYPREVEASIVRLAQMARAVGMHLVVSTQRPSVEIITGLIKANITSRVALNVASQIDSRTILDVAGAEKLLGHGDMLYLAGDTARARRIQGVFVSEAEVKRVVQYLRGLEPLPIDEHIFEDAAAESGGIAGDDIDDDLYEDARMVVIEAGKASASYLQRRLRVGYARAARLLDMLEERNVIGPGEGARPREVLVKPARDEVRSDSSDMGIV